MKLQYTKSLPKTASSMVFMLDGAQRVEFHLRKDPSSQYTLIIFAGSEEQITKSLAQGPFELLDQAVAARNAIAQSIQQRGYNLSDKVAIWSINAQKFIKNARSVKSSTGLKFEFDPKDVFLDW